MAKQRFSTEHRRQQIAEAALHIISEQGVHKLTVAEIGKMVGLADGSIFRHYTSKQEIITAALDHFEALLFEGFPPEHADPMERLRTFVLSRLAMLQKQPSIVKLVFNDRLAEAGGPEHATRVQTFMARSMIFMRDCLVEAQREGDAPEELPVESLVWAVTGIVRGMAMSYLAGYAMMTADDAWDAIARLLASAARGERTETSAR